MKKFVMGMTAAILSLLAGVSYAEYGLNFPEPATPIARHIFDLHMLTSKIITILLIIAVAFILYSVYAHRKSRGYQADQTMHKGWFGTWSWILVPAMVLGVDLTIAGSAQKSLVDMWEAPQTRCTAESKPDDKCYDMIVKVTGHQWWWEYSYMDEGITIESRYTPKEQAGDQYLRAVDNQLVLPVGKKIRFLHTSADVNHAFWVPELGMKKDAIAGYITETWAELDRKGTFRGQCAELCGTWHARMPIVVAAVDQSEFDTWVGKKQQAMQLALAEASADKVWSKDELMAKGKETYDLKCAACHQVSGEGLPPTFPALKGSVIAKGPVAAHIHMVLNGKNVMPAWNSMNDLELAAVITYERNAWGNDTGDVVQPADIKAAR